MKEKEAWFARSFMDTPIGRLRMEEDACGITMLKLEREDPAPEETGGDGRFIPLLKKELPEYFAGRRKAFDIPLSVRGTEFQKKVWAALRTIPYGETRSYGEIAAAVGNPKAARAVGMANNKNPILILTPCHRVIGADGSMVGFGCGISRKVYLLELEKKNSAEPCPEDPEEELPFF